jgi:hypothetical protein
MVSSEVFHKFVSTLANICVGYWFVSTQAIDRKNWEISTNEKTIHLIVYVLYTQVIDRNNWQISSNEKLTTWLWKLMFSWS